MSSSDPTGISLADLPPDVLRFIVPMTEAPRQLKYVSVFFYFINGQLVIILQISPVWSTITEDYLLRNPIPIDRVHICVTESSDVKIGLATQTKYLYHFGIVKWAKVIEYANNEVDSVRVKFNEIKFFAGSRLLTASSLL